MDAVVAAIHLSTYAAAYQQHPMSGPFAYTLSKSRVVEKSSRLCYRREAGALCQREIGEHFYIYWSISRLDKYNKYHMGQKNCGTTQLFEAIVVLLARMLF